MSKLFYKQVGASILQKPQPTYSMPIHGICEVDRGTRKKGGQAWIRACPRRRANEYLHNTHGSIPDMIAQLGSIDKIRHR